MSNFFLGIKIFNTRILLLALFSTIIFSEEKNITIACILDGESSINFENYGDIKLQYLIEYNSLEVVSIKNDFLTDYDFLESAIWSVGFGIGALKIVNSVSENEIKIFLDDIPGSFNNDDNPTLYVNWANWNVLINRKTGIVKTDASYSYIIDNTDVDIDFMTEEDLAILRTKKNYHIEYSALGTCSKKENKF